jgi:hypothetical protein
MLMPDFIPNGPQERPASSPLTIAPDIKKTKTKMIGGIVFILKKEKNKEMKSRGK